MENTLSGQPGPLEQLHVAVKGPDGPARIGVVGAGPAGLSCAHDLGLLGYRVTLFDSAPVVGGMLYQGVPEYRLSRDLIRAEVDRILTLGVELKLGWKLGRDFTVGDLRRNGYAAVFLALGASRGRELNITGSDLDGVINGVDFLLNANLGYHVALGDRVIVIGGGNVAVDVARTALRYSAARESRSCRSLPSSCCKPGGTTTPSSTRHGPPCGSARATSSLSRSSRAWRCRRLPTRSAKPRKKGSRSRPDWGRKRFSEKTAAPSGRDARCRVGV